MKIDPNSPAFPRPGQVVYDYEGKPLNPYGGHGWAEEPIPGLTIRAHFAAMAMHGIIAAQASPNYQKALSVCAGESDTGVTSVVADMATEYADALLAALNKEGK